MSGKENTEERSLPPLLSFLYSSPKLSVSHIRLSLADSHINSLSMTDDYHLAFGTGDGGVEKISFQHYIVAFQHRNDDGPVLRPL